MSDQRSKTRSVWNLFGLSLKASWARLRYDLYTEITFLLSAAILAATFFYIFGDFISVRLGQVSTHLAAHLGNGMGVALVMAACASLWVRWSDHKAEDEYRLLALNLGESQSVVDGWIRLRRGFILLLHLLPTQVLAQQLFFHWPWWGQWLVWLVGLFVVSLLIRAGITPMQKTSPEAQQPRPAGGKGGLLEDQDVHASKAWLMLKWRVSQLCRRNRSAQVSGGLGGVFLGLYALSVWWQVPLPGLFLTLSASAVFVTMMLSMQLQEDLRAAWLERNLGVAHEDLVGTYWIIGLVLSLMTLIIAGLVHALVYGWSWESLQMGAVAGVLPVLFSSSMLQLEPRRPLVQLMVWVLLQLFIGTALIAHVLTMLLVPIVIVYGHQLQAGRYYRA